jgi:hypothetical protein
MLDLIKSLDIIERASFDGAETVRRIQEFSRKRSDDKDFTRLILMNYWKMSLILPACAGKMKLSRRECRLPLTRTLLLCLLP